MIVPINVIGISIMLSFYVRRMRRLDQKREREQNGRGKSIFNSNPTWIGWMDILLPLGAWSLDQLTKMK